jgi:hypothetical protein
MRLSFDLRYLVQRNRQEKNRRTALIDQPRKTGKRHRSAGIHINHDALQTGIILKNVVSNCLSRDLSNAHDLACEFSSSSIEH